MSKPIYPPCAFCQREGGYRLSPNGPLYPPTESCPPSTGQQWFTNELGSKVAPVWSDLPACPTHYHQIVERQYGTEIANRRDR